MTKKRGESVHEIVVGFTTCPYRHYGYFPTIFIMNMMKITARNPAAETAAFVRAPEIDAANVRAANATARMRRTTAANGLLSFDVTLICFFHRPPHAG